MSLLIYIAALLFISLALTFHEDSKIVSFICVFISCFLLCWLNDIDKKESYKQGQVDALTGKIEYKLVVQPDSTKSWEKIDKENKFSKPFVKGVY